MIRILSTALLLLLVISCGGGADEEDGNTSDETSQNETPDETSENEDSDNDEETPVAGAQLVCLPSSVKLLTGQTYKPACYAYDDDGGIIMASAADIEAGNISIEFSTQSKGVIQVSPQGQVTAEQAGNEAMVAVFTSANSDLTLSDKIDFTIEQSDANPNAALDSSRRLPGNLDRQNSAFTDNAKLYVSETSIWLGEGSSKDVYISAENELQQLTDVDCETTAYLTHEDTVSVELIDAGDMHQYRFTGIQKGFSHGYFGCTDGSLQTPPFTIQVKNPTTLANPTESGLATINGDPQMWLSPAGFPYVSSYSETEDRLLITAVTGAAQAKSLEITLADENRAGRVSTIGADLLEPNRPRLISLFDDGGEGSLGEITFDELTRPSTRSLKPGWVADYSNSSLLQLETATAADKSSQWFSASDGSAIHLFSYQPAQGRFRQTARIDVYAGSIQDAELALPPPSNQCADNQPVVAQCQGSDGLWIGQASASNPASWNFRQVTRNSCNSIELAIDTANRAYLAWSRGDSENGEELILNQIHNGNLYSSTVANLQDGQIFTDIELDLDRNGIPRIVAVVENTSDQSRALYQYTYSTESGSERWQIDQVEYTNTIGPELDFVINRYGLSAIVLQPNNSELAYLVQPAFVDYSPSYFPFGEGSCDQLLPSSGELITVELDYDQDGISDLLDEDDDNDGIPDTLDGDPLDNRLSGTDTDNDGIDNAIDTDDDNDGISDDLDLFPLDSAEWEDADGDGIGNNADTDNDNDGVPDTLDAFPFDASETLDTDGDGIGNNADTDDDNDSVPDDSDAFPLDATRSGSDLDGDGLDDVIDPDDDGDGVNDDADLFPTDASESADYDGDGIGNNADTDDDNDGVEDAQDSEPFNNQISGIDTDNDGTDNAVDTDDDNDGYLDENDSEPTNDQISGHDNDEDGLDDAVDNDRDNDGITNDQDSDPLDNQLSGVDSDQDGIDDAVDGTINFRPVLSGSPSGVVAITNEYLFTPVGSDQDGQTLTFSINTLPSWASFDVTAGTISGTPQPNDVGLTESIVISTTDGIETTEMAPFNLRVTNLTDLILEYETAQVPALDNSGENWPGWQAWSLIVSNPTGEDRTNVVLKMTWPTAFMEIAEGRFIDGDCSGRSCTGGETVTWNLGTLKVGESHKVWLPSAIPSGQNSIALQATVTDDSAKTVVLADIIPVVTDRPLDVSVASSKYSVTVGEVMRFEVNYAASPDFSASEETLLTLNLPSSFQPSIFSQSATTVAGNVLTWNLGTLQPDATGKIWVEGVVSSSAPAGTQLQSTASLTNKTGRQTTATTFVPVSATRLVDIEFETPPSPAPRGVWAPVKIKVTNRSAEALDDLSLRMRIPRGSGSFDDGESRFVTDRNDACDYTTCDNGERVFWTIDSLAAGETTSVDAIMPLEKFSLIEYFAEVWDNGVQIATAKADIGLTAKDFLSTSVAASTYPAEPGETIQYQVSYGYSKTTSNSTNTNLTLDLPAGLTINSVSNSGAIDTTTNSISWTLGTLSPGETGQTSVEVTLDAALSVEHIDAIAQLSNSVDSSASAITSVPVVPVRKVDMDIDVAPGPVEPGEGINARITFTNRTDTDMDMLSIQFRHPVSMVSIDDGEARFVTDDSDVCDYTYCEAGETVHWYDFGTLPAGSSMSVDMQTWLLGTTTAGELIEFWAKMESDGIQYAEAKQYVQIGANRYLSTAVSASAYPAEPGETISYQVSYGYSKTTGNSTNTQLTLDLPPQLTILSATNGGVIDTATQQVSWNLGILPPGTTGQAVVEVTLNEDLDVEHLDAIAQLESDGNAIATAVNTVPIIPVRTVDMDIDVAPGPAKPGEGMTARITFTNRTDSDITAANIQLRHPAKMVSLDDGESRFVTDQNDACDHTHCEAGERISWYGITIPAKQSHTVEVQTWLNSASKPGQLVEFWAKMESGNIQYASAKQDVPISSPRYLSTSVAASTYPAEPGETIQYQVSYGYSKTTGNSDNSVLTLDLPDGITINAASHTGVIDTSSNTVAWALGTLSPGETGQTSVEVTLDASLSVEHIDAIAQLTNGVDSRASAITSVPVVPVRKVDMDIDVAPGPVEPGEGINARITFTNRTNTDMDTLSIQFRHPVSMVSIDDGEARFVTDDSDVCDYTYCEAGETVHWYDFGTLPAGSSMSVDMQTWLLGTTTAGELIEFWAKMESDGIQYAEAKQDVQIGANRYLSTAVSASTYPAEPGETIQYQVSYGYSKTTGNSTNTQLTLDLPPQLTILSATNGGVIDTTTKQVSWNLGTLPPGTTGQAVVEVTLNEDLDIEHLDAIAQLESDGNTIASVVNTVPIVTERQVDMTISVAPSNPKPGEQVVVSIRVDNNNDIDMASPAIRFRHAYSMAQIYDNGGSTTDTSDACDYTHCEAGETVNWTGLSIAAGTSKTVEMTTVVDGTATPGQLIEFWAKVEEAPESGDIQRASARAVIGVD